MIHCNRKECLFIDLPNSYKNSHNIWMSYMRHSFNIFEVFSDIQNHLQYQKVRKWFSDIRNSNSWYQINLRISPLQKRASFFPKTSSAFKILPRCWPNRKNHLLTHYSNMTTLCIVLCHLFLINRLFRWSESSVYLPHMASGWLTYFYTPRNKLRRV